MIRQMLGVATVALLFAGTASAQTVQTVDDAGLKKAIAANKGKVVVVNYWATWCGPCIAEFPDLVKLYKDNKAKGVELVTVSCDDSEDMTKVKSFLNKQGLNKGLLNQNGPDILGQLKFLEPGLNENASVGIPRTYIINRKGKVVKTLTGGQDLKTFQKAIQPYL